MDLALYFAPEACSRVPLIALEEIGVPDAARLLAFVAGEHRSPEYLALNPAGKVPTLVADGQPIAQNTAIALFLARSFPEAGLLPLSGNVANDADVTSRLVRFSADVHPLVTRIRMPQFFCDVEGGPERVRELGCAAIAAQLGTYERSLGDRPWLLESGWSVLDAYLFWVWFRIVGAGFTGDFPNIAAHHARMQERP